ncbi:MAG: exosortase [Acidobacteriia bacterium]|nr:exosortase [Terriglobia bacterium]
MNQAGEGVAARPAEQATTRSQARPLWIILAGAMLALVAVLYHGILATLALDWWNDPNFSHGFFVPAFSLFVLWQERAQLAKLEPRPSWWGSFFVAGALAMLIVGSLGAEFFLSRTSFIVLLGGLVIQFFGWQVFRAILFPWAVLFLMVPIPAIIFNQITFPLQLFASRLATVLLTLLGVPVLREGNVIQLPIMSLEVAEACSGIRSLVSLTTLAVIYGYFIETRTSRRVWMAVFAVPIAVAANAMRVMGTGLVAQYWDPSKAEGFFHEFSGWFIFILSLGMLLLVHRAMRLFDRAARVSSQ